MNRARRWVRFRSADGRTAFGVLDRDHIEEFEGDLFRGASPTGRALRRDEASLLAPCVPTKIVALWNNFHALSAKLGKRPPRRPLFLIKPSSSVCGHGASIQRPLSYDGKIAYEGELGIVIGSACRNVTEDEAADSIFGYTCVNDVTAVELLYEDADFQQWTRAKGYDTFTCLGPTIAQGFDLREGRVVTKVDGVERQNYTLSDMVFSPTQQVSLISQDMSLLPGDVIASGTSLGVGSLKDGSTVEISIEGIGVLTNTLQAT